MAQLMFAAFGPLRFFDALLWLIGAAALRVVAYGKGMDGLPAYYLAAVFVVIAYVATARRAIEALGGQADLSQTTLWQDFFVSLRMFSHVHFLVLGVTFALYVFDRPGQAVHFLNVIDGMAFDQLPDISKFWSASIAAVVLMMVVSADSGKVNLTETVRGLAMHWRWLTSGVLALVMAYVVLHYGQGVVREAIRTFWQTSDASQFVKNLMFFVFIFSFATLRLWVTVFILTWSLKQSCLRGREERPSA